MWVLIEMSLMYLAKFSGNNTVGTQNREQNLRNKFETYRHRDGVEASTTQRESAQMERKRILSAGKERGFGKHK